MIFSSAPTGDLLAVDSILECNQRILRRLLTNQKGYIWNAAYGAGLPAHVGSTIDQSELQSLISSQMGLEASVVQSPSPQVITNPLSNGLEVDISYVEQDSAAPVNLSFEVTP